MIGEDAERTIVAFAGHASAEDVGDPARAGVALDVAFALVREAARTRLVLLTGNADGADALAAARWRDGQFGPVRRVYPFVGDLGDDPVEADTSGDAWLDGAAAARIALHPHLEQTRWLVAHADLMIALWTGKPARPRRRRGRGPARARRGRRGAVGVARRWRAAADRPASDRRAPVAARGRRRARRARADRRGAS